MQIDLLRSSLIFFLAALVGCASSADVSRPIKSSISVEEKVLPTNSTPSLKELIARQHPDIENPQTSDWQKVNILRRWAYKNIDLGKGSCDLGKILKPSFYQMNASDLFAAFQQDLGGFLCGGAAVSLVKLYQEYGFKAHYLAIGKVGYMTHAVALVQIQDKGQKKFAIEDSYLNVTYTHLDGSPLDYFELLSLLKNRDRHQVRVVQDNDGERDYIFCDGNPLPPANSVVMARFKQSCVEIAGGKVKCRGRSVLEDMTENDPVSIKTKQWLADSGYEADFIYLFMAPFALNDVTSDRKDLFDRAQAIIKGNLSSSSGHDVFLRSAL